MLYFSRDLDSDQMTLMYECDRDIAKMYMHTNNEFSRSKLLKVTA